MERGEIITGRIAPKTRSDKNKKEELVLTPGGWRPKSKVHYVAPGHHIDAQGGRLRIMHAETRKVIKDLGKIHAVREEKGGKRVSRVKLAKMKMKKGAPKPITNRWIVHSGWTNNAGNPISYFKTRWSVPPEPATDNNQTIFLFNGLCQTSAGPFILQPVLQWGLSYAGGGKYWSITNWYVGAGDVALHGPLIRVNPGDVLEGIMTLTGQSGTSFSYISTFTGFKTADLTVNNINELRWACEALECYGFLAFTDYPATPLTAMHDIEIRARTATTPNIIDMNPTLNWVAYNDVTDNGQQCLIVSNDNPGGDVYLYYRHVTQRLSFFTKIRSFGKETIEHALATAGGRIPYAFWVVLEGFTIDQLTIDQPNPPLRPVLSGGFENLSGVTIMPNSSGPEYAHPGDIYMPQRIRFPFDIQFTSAALTSFPNWPRPLWKLISASMTIGGITLRAPSRR